MTKKIYLLLLAMVLLPFLCVCAFPNEVQLQVGYDDPKINQPGDPKTPVQIPEVYIDDYTLSFDNSCLGCELRLLDEDGALVCSTIITSNTLVLPAYLSGEYELHIIRGIYCFFGYIYL